MTTNVRAFDLQDFLSGLPGTGTSTGSPDATKMYCQIEEVAANNADDDNQNDAEDDAEDDAEEEDVAENDDDGKDTEETGDTQWASILSAFLQDDKGWNVVDAIVQNSKVHMRICRALERIAELLEKS